MRHYINSFLKYWCFEICVVSNFFKAKCCKTLHLYFRKRNETISKIPHGLVKLLPTRQHLWSHDVSFLNLSGQNDIRHARTDIYDSRQLQLLCNTLEQECGY
uniref:Uncharacterized protein isoform X3 n=1 Tax=Nicotiana tabacum TaxID=4097 RepID=A0A1S4CUS8_TOBAC|nr:PREDICTED: uncharacterized protein LOC107822810 isoform X3 [Nicotiana tabacum]